MTLAPHSQRIVSGLGEEADSHTGHAPAATHQSLHVLDLDKRTYDRSLDCVHCGLCLPACPTYTQTGLEADSPRGRIQLMKGLADGRIDATASVVEHLDLCLDCRACETACPSGVVYHELIEETREKLHVSRPRTLTDAIVEAMFLHVFTHTTRLRLALLPVRLLQKLGLWQAITESPIARAMPDKLDKMRQMLPTHGPMWEKPLEAYYPANAPDGIRRARVAFLAGCVGSVLFQHVNRMAVRLLQHAGCDVIVPRNQACCGAIHHHAGHVDHARGLARLNIDVLMPDGEEPIDYVVNNISGCGAMLKDYAHLLRDDPVHGPKAESFVKKTRDISQLLVELKPVLPERTLSRTVTYHDACHLVHGQKVASAPRELLSWIKGLKVIPLRESDMCCGAAGTYNLTQPQMARDLAERKIRHIEATGARLCVTGNVGCAMQIQSEAERLGVELHVAHPVALLHEAYFGEEPR